MSSQPAAPPPWIVVESTQLLPQLVVPLLETNVLQIWHVDLEHADALFAPCYAVLNALERERADARRQLLSRQHVVIGRGCLRILLGHALTLDPAHVHLAAGAHRKPQLIENELPSAITFNVAHSADTILIALARLPTIGIDVERIEQAMDFTPVAQNSLTPAELAELLSVHDPAWQRRAFYRCWTHKEAVAKADGRGLLLPMTTFEVPLAPVNDQPVTLPDSTNVFYLSTLPFADDVAAAVAVSVPDISMKLLRFPPAISPIKS